MEVYVVDCVTGTTKNITTTSLSYAELYLEIKCSQVLEGKEKNISFYERFLGKYIPVFDLSRKISPFSKIEIYDENSVFTLSNSKNVVFEMTSKIDEIYSSPLIEVQKEEPIFIHKMDLTTGRKQIVDVLDDSSRYHNQCVNRLIKNYNY